MSAWILRAIEQHHPMLAVALAHSLPLLVAEDVWGLGTREMVAGDCLTIGNKN